MNQLTEYQQRMHDLLMEYATTRFLIKGGKHASKKTAKDYTESLERYLPKEATTRFGLETFPETAYDVRDISVLEQLRDIIEENPDWKKYDQNAHGSTFKRGLTCLIEMRRDVDFLQSKEIEENSTTIEFAASFQNHYEGNAYVSHCTKYERDPKLREECLRLKGYKCCVCGFDFEKIYGELGKGFIEIHHTTPLSEIGEAHMVSPLEDLVPLCSNCHSMVHRIVPAMDIDELKGIMRNSQDV